MPVSHSAGVNRTSRAKACRWRTAASMISFRRGSGVFAICASAASVTVIFVEVLHGTLLWSASREHRPNERCVRPGPGVAFLGTIGCAQAIKREALPMLPRRFAFAAAAALAFLGLQRQGHAGAGGDPDHHRLRHGADRRPRAERQGGAARDADLGGRHQCQGRSARPAGEAGLLRRPVQPRDHSGHLYQAARRGQGGPGRQRLRHQHDRARDADHHAAQPDLPRACSGWR